MTDKPDGGPAFPSPVDVCETCDGRGLIWATIHDCPDCKGTGKADAMIAARTTTAHVQEE